MCRPACRACTHALLATHDNRATCPWSSSCVTCQQRSNVLAKILIPEGALDEEEQQQDLQKALRTWVGEAKRCRALLPDRYWLLHVLERGFADEAIVADALDVEQTSVGCKADLAQSGKVLDTSADAEVAGIVDRRFGSKRLQQLVVLLDAGLLVVDVQGRHDAVCDDAVKDDQVCGG